MGLIEYLILAALVLVVIGVEWELSRIPKLDDRLDDYNENPR